MWCVSVTSGARISVGSVTVGQSREVRVSERDNASRAEGATTTTNRRVARRVFKGLLVGPDIALREHLVPHAPPPSASALQASQRKRSPP
jgi:hypothetical protein